MSMDSIICSVQQIIKLVMDTQSIFRRIIDIKKMSVQLKQTTEDPHTANNDLIKGILKLGKETNPMRFSMPDEHHGLASIQEADQILADQRSNKNQSSDILGVFTNVLKSGISQTHGENSSMAMEPSMVFSKAWQEQLTPAQQISELKGQNSELQQQIKHLQQKLRKLQQLEKQQRQQQWKDGLPYFMLHIPRIKIFYTKLTISQKDYDKIDYSLYAVDLTLERIILNQLYQPGASSRPPKNISLLLSELKEVSYHSPKQNKNAIPFTIGQRNKQIDTQQYLIVYYFKYNKQFQKPKSKKRKSSFFRQVGEDKIKQKQEDYEIVQTLFMKFEREEDFKEWDLGVFINYKIMEDLGKSDPKVSHYSSMNNSGLTAQNQQNSNKLTQGNNQNFKNLLDKLANKNSSSDQNTPPRQENYIKLTNMDEQKTKTIQQYLQQMHGESKLSSNLKKFNSNTDQSNNIKPLQIPIQKRDNGTIKIVDQPQSPIKQSRAIPDRGSFEQIINKQRSDTSHFGQHSPLLSAQDKSKQLQLEKLEAEQAKRQKMLDAEEQARKQAERMEAMKQMEHSLSIKKARQVLRKGYFMIKYAKNALSPYEKRVYLNQDGKRLCWEDIKKPGESKWILISEITNIKQGEIGKGVEEHLSLKKISKKGCFVVIYLDSKDRQTLEFGCEDQLVMEQFCKDLQLYRSNLP